MGDRALIIEVGDEINPSVNKKVGQLLSQIETKNIVGIVDLVPCYSSLLVIYDSLKISLSELRGTIDGLYNTIDTSTIPEHKTHKIPVAYGGENGPDLLWVAEYHNITPEDVVKLHTGTKYQVYMIGFSPGFAYMGEIPESLVTPRRETPRTEVPRGSVGIAINQTGIYPSVSPGGWQIIGKTPLKLFDPFQRPPTHLQMGDLVEFYQIDSKDLEHWQA
jgi:KipI family sensor histidine kinase inhibitor